MKRLILALALMVFVTAPAFAQQTPIYSYIDFPSQGYVGPVSYLAGWALTCTTGQQPPLVYAYEMTDNRMVPLAVRVSWRVSRPDVRDAFMGSCSFMSSPYLGLHVVPETPFAPGPHLIVLLYWDPMMSSIPRIDQVWFTATGGGE